MEGVEVAALEAGLRAGLETGGALQGPWSQNAALLAERYGTRHGARRENIESTDGTCVVAVGMNNAFEIVCHECRSASKPVIVLHSFSPQSAESALQFIASNNVKSLNVTGAKHSYIERDALRFFDGLFSRAKG